MLSRKEAIATGATHYHGKMCEKHNISKRITIDCKCVECAKDQKKTYYIKNKEVVRQRASKYHQQNRQQLLAKMRQRYMTKQIDGVSIYALSLKSSPTEYFYVGRTSTPTVRIHQHKSDSRRAVGTNIEKELIIRKALNDEDDDVLMTILEVIPKNRWSDAENEWINKLRNDGHPLTNTASGTILGEWDEDYAPPAPIPKTIKEWNDIKWERDHPLAKRGEWYANAMGASLFRTGWSKCRIKTSTGIYTVHGIDKESLGQKVCVTLTVGSPEHEFMMQQNQQAIRARCDIL